MSGKRLLDAAALLHATRAVAQKHSALRSHQLDVYVKTSSLAKGIKSQTERVTQTVVAAGALLSRVNGPGVAAADGGSWKVEVGGAERGTAKSGEGNGRDGELSKGHDQDVFYDRPTDESARPVGTESSGPGKPTQEKIPLKTEDSQAGVDQVDDGQINSDVFYGTGEEGAKPQMPKIPQRTADSQASVEQVEDGKINSDTFYESQGETTTTSTDQELEVVQEQQQEQGLEGINTEIFQSPRIAKLLSAAENKRRMEKEFHSEVATATSNHGLNQNGLKENLDPAWSSIPEVQGQAMADKGIQDLAADLSQDLSTPAVRIAFQKRHQRPVG